MASPYQPGDLGRFLSASGLTAAEPTTSKDSTLFRERKRKIKDVKTGQTDATPDKPKTGKSSRRKKQAVPEKINDPSENERTIFVGNLSSSTTRKELKVLFGKYGKIESCRLRSAVPSNPKKPKKFAVIKHDFKDGLDKINGYVKFANTADATKALNENGAIYKEHRLRVDSCGAPKKYDEKHSVFVGNLPFTVMEDDLFGHFKDCGDIDCVRLIRDRQTGFGKGIGFVVFKDACSVSLALALDSQELNGRPLRVSVAGSKKPKLKKFKDKDSAKPGQKRESGFVVGSKPKKRKIAAGNKEEKRLPKAKAKKLKQKKKKQKSLLH